MHSMAHSRRRVHATYASLLRSTDGSIITPQGRNYNFHDNTRSLRFYSPTVKTNRRHMLTHTYSLHRTYTIRGEGEDVLSTERFPFSLRMYDVDTNSTGDFHVPPP